MYKKRNILCDKYDVFVLKCRLIKMATSKLKNSIIKNCINYIQYKLYKVI